MILNFYQSAFMTTRVYLMRGFFNVKTLAALSAVMFFSACSESKNDTAAAASKPATEEKVVNLYSARHYDVDDKLYAEFTKQTGIKVNVVKGKAPELIEKLKMEGDASSADIFMTVDGGILNSAKEAGLLQAIDSPKVLEAVPANLRDADNQWVALSSRARIIAYVKGKTDPSTLSTYEDLANEKWKGKVLVRSSTNLYNQSWIASMIALDGAEKTETWVKGMVANLAQEPKGGDRDQAKAIVAGTGEVAIMNTYYVGLMANSTDPEEKKIGESIGVFFPNQATTGTHINISGAGLTKSSKNKAHATQLIEFLTDVPAQEMVSNENYEFPVNPKAQPAELLRSWGTFKTQQINFAELGKNNAAAIALMGKTGWK